MCCWNIYTSKIIIHPVHTEHIRESTDQLWMHIPQRLPNTMQRERYNPSSTERSRECEHFLGSKCNDDPSQNSTVACKLHDDRPKRMLLQTRDQSRHLSPTKPLGREIGELRSGGSALIYIKLRASIACRYRRFPSKWEPLLGDCPATRWSTWSNYVSLNS
jgi:hypothetical protein